MNDKIEVIANRKGYKVNDKGVVFSFTGKQLKLNESKGYKRFNIRCSDMVRPCNVHRLQAYQKFGDKIYLKNIHVRHKNNISTDNSFENILIGTPSENAMDNPKEDRVKRANHATSFWRKYDKDIVKSFHKENGRSYKKTMSNFNITSKGTLNYILNN